MQSKQCAFEHLLNTTLNWVFSFLIIVNLGGKRGEGKLWTILLPGYSVLV